MPLSVSSQLTWQPQPETNFPAQAIIIGMICSQEGTPELVYDVHTVSNLELAFRNHCLWTKARLSMVEIQNQNVSSLESFLHDHSAKSFLLQYILKQNILWKEASKFGKIFHYLTYYIVYSRHMADTLQYLSFLKGSITLYLLWLPPPPPRIS